MGSKKNKIDLKQSVMPDYIFTLFCVSFFGIFPIIMHNKYFDITNTRYSFFTISSLVFVCLCFLAYIFQDVISEYNQMPSLFYKEKFNYKNPCFWMILFAFSNVYSMLLSPNILDAFTGRNGRFMGAWTYIVIAMTFLLITNRVKYQMFPIIVFTVSCLFSYIVAICQHMGNDFMNYKENIAKKQYYIFVSTFGNINIFASFMVISLALFMALYIFSKKLVVRIISAIMISLGAICLMIANSDSAFIGVTVVSLLLMYVSFNENCFYRFVETIIYIFTGIFILVLLNKKVIKKYDKRGGVAQALDRIWLVVLILVVLLVFYLIVRLIKKKLAKDISKENKKKIMISFTVFLVICGIAGIVVCIITDRAITKFNYRWGTFRGYIWSKCIDLFCNGTILQKLSGYGNETLEMLTKSNYYDEMIAVTKKVYDNAHNELLQYLVTLGLFGLISYIGLFVSAVSYIFKNMKDSIIAHISLAVVVGYFAQSLINLNQPITTPYFFVFMAIGIGAIRYDKWLALHED